jgi:ribosomal-protein-alanine N-acetyltransferase
MEHPKSTAAYLQGFETERLFIRPLNIADIAEWQLFFDDPLSDRFIPVAHIEGREAKARYMIEKQMGRYAEGSYGLQALISKEDRALVGICGLLSQVIDNEPELEVGYHLRPTFRGKGYATEAARFFRSYASEQGLSKRIVSIIHKDNTASQAVAIRNGLSIEKASMYGDMPIVVYAAWME